MLPSATIRGLTAAEWLSYFVVVFGSSALSGVVSSSVRAASQQVLMPTKVAGETAWYAGLDRPSWEPPGIVFPIMWLLVSKPTQLLAITKLAASVGDAEFPWVPQLAVRLPRGRSADGSQRRRGYDVDSPWRRVAAAPRLRRRYSVETGRGDTAVATTPRSRRG